MGIIDIIFIAIGLAMDAFAVATCKGLALGKLKFKHYIIIGTWFGGFQALMPLAGYLLGSVFSGYIERYDHWVAFGLLSLIGANMIREAFSEDEEEGDCANLSVATMLGLAVATSIDALAVGVTFATFSFAKIVTSIILIGAITFVISVTGVKIGNAFGTRYRQKAEIAGGAILVVLALKLLLEGLL